MVSCSIFRSLLPSCGLGFGGEACRSLRVTVREASYCCRACTIFTGTSWVIQSYLSSQSFLSSTEQISLWGLFSCLSREPLFRLHHRTLCSRSKMWHQGRLPPRMLCWAAKARNRCNPLFHPSLLSYHAPPSTKQHWTARLFSPISPLSAPSVHYLCDKSPRLKVLCRRQLRGARAVARQLREDILPSATTEGDASR